jgi:hypothetical protein
MAISTKQFYLGIGCVLKEPIPKTCIGASETKVIINAFSVLSRFNVDKGISNGLETWTKGPYIRLVHQGNSCFTKNTH